MPLTHSPSGEVRNSGVLRDLTRLILLAACPTHPDSVDATGVG
jgi:hypothetical protein